VLVIASLHEAAIVVEYRDSSNRSAGRVIDWGAVAGLALEWAFTLGQYFFWVLVFGLIGGSVGGLAEFQLPLVESWVGRGPESGWVIGALPMAIGLLLGWIRINGKKLLLPKTRTLRKRVSASVLERREKKKHDFHGIRDIFQGGGVAGLIGGFAGVFLGVILSLCWASLAMSPLARVGPAKPVPLTAEAPLEEPRAPRDEDRGFFQLPRVKPAQLFFWPVWSLAAAGVLVGTLYGAAHYLDYVSTVPAGIREKQRRKKRLPVVEAFEANKAAIEQGLPLLAPPPRAVPLRACWQLLRGDAGVFLLIGAFFFAVGIVMTTMIMFEWREAPRQTQHITVVLPLTFAGIGLAILIAGTRSWGRKIRILRYGYLVHCRIVQCKDAQTGRWKTYEAALDQLRGAWDKPLAAYNRRANTKSFERFATVFGWFALLVFAMMGVVGVIFTCGIIFIAVTQHEPVAYFGLLFVAVWWTVLVWMARSFLRIVPPLKRVGSQSLRTLGVKPVVKCRAQFALPNGKTVELKTQIDLSRCLDASREPYHVAVYDPLKPSNALILSHFERALEVAVDGSWRWAAQVEI
jgi:hypothetical protein